MYKLILIVSLIFSGQVYSQTNQAGNKQLPWLSDTLSARIASQLAVKKEIADSLLSLIYTSRTAISTVLQNKTLTSEDKNAQVKMIADARNAVIEKLLRPEQIEKLKAIMAVEKEKWKQKQ
ncbi:MAG TPA: hypothetical protein VF008_23845 [Niastella sp.]